MTQSVNNANYMYTLRGETGTFAEFLRTRPGLWVSDDFRQRIVARASGEGVVRKTHIFVLSHNMSDAEIEDKLSENHFWDEADLCATIAHMIMVQSGGKSGELLNNGRANLFYTSSCVVLVGWRAGLGEWSVFTWLRGVSMWDAGNQAFSPATE